MHHSLLGVQQTGDSEDNSPLFISWVRAPCLNKSDNSPWENSGNVTVFSGLCVSQARGRSEDLEAKLSICYQCGTPKKNSPARYSLLWPFICSDTPSFLEKPQSANCVLAYQRSEFNNDAESSGTYTEIHRVTGTCTHSHSKHMLTKLWRPLKCYPRRPCIS